MKPKERVRTRPDFGWMKATRTQDAIELGIASQRAFFLLYVIARRANWHPGYNAKGLDHGEAFIGDYKNIGFTEQEYRTAKALLAKGGFATFRSTNKGTIARLADMRVFCVSEVPANEQNNGCSTASQRAANGPTTTNEDQYKSSKSNKEPKEVDHSGSQAHLRGCSEARAVHVSPSGREIPYKPNKPPQGDKAWDYCDDEGYWEHNQAGCEETLNRLDENGWRRDGKPIYCWPAFLDTSPHLNPNADCGSVSGPAKAAKARIVAVKRTANVKGRARIVAVKRTACLGLAPSS